MGSKVPQRSRNWRQLTWRQRSVFFSALLLLPVVDLLLRAFDYQTVYERARDFVPLQTRATGIDIREQSRETAAIIDLAGRWRAIDSSCMRRSLVLWILLRRQGIKSELRLGIRKAQGVIFGHAWVEVDGAAINDEKDVADRYLVFGPEMLP